MQSQLLGNFTYQILLRQMAVNEIKFIFSQSSGGCELHQAEAMVQGPLGTGY